MDDDHELAVRLTHEEQEMYTTKERARLLAEYFEIRKKQLAAERAEAIRNKPPTRTQVRNKMITYLKHIGKYPHQQLKHKTLEELQMLYEREKKWIDDFVPIDSKKEEKKSAEPEKKRYPPIKETLEKMFNWKLEAEAKSVEPTIEVSNSNPFDVLNSVNNDVYFGINGGTTNLDLTSGKDGSDKGYGTNSLLEQWKDSYSDNDDYDPYDDDIAIFLAVASFFFWQWQSSSLAVGTSSASGNFIPGSGNTLCILFPTILP
nr:hypothetical protein [Tanacetum cinerariifolium]